MAVIVLLGPQGTGKSQMGEAIARLYQIPFDDGIRKSLANTALLDVQQGRVASSAFERLVGAVELARDRSSRGAPRVIHSWHAGNLAYLEANAPDLLPEEFLRVRAHIRRLGVTVVPLLRPLAYMRSVYGCSDTMSRAFHIATRSVYWARRLGLRVMPPLLTDADDPETLALRVGAKLRLNVPIDSKNPVHEKTWFEGAHRPRVPGSARAISLLWPTVLS